MRFIYCCSAKEACADRCGHRVQRRDNSQQPTRSPIANMWDNPIKRRPQLIAVIVTGNGPGDKALGIREDQVNLLKHKMLLMYRSL